MTTPLVRTESARPRNFSPWFQVVTRLLATEESDPLPDGDLDALRQLAGPVRRSGSGCRSRPGRHRSHPDARSTTGEPADGYRRHRLVLDTEDTMSVPAYLLVPDGREAPGSAVLAIHGHGPGKSRICGTRTG